MSHPNDRRPDPNMKPESGFYGETDKARLICYIKMPF